MNLSNCLLYKVDAVNRHSNPIQLIINGYVNTNRFKCILFKDIEKFLKEVLEDDFHKVLMPDDSETKIVESFLVRKKIFK